MAPNDDPDAGPDTNAGVGATAAPADQPDNSNHFDSYDDYREQIDGLAEINESQKTGDEPSVPSTVVPDAKVDNTSGGNINTPTPVTSPATVADTGKAIADDPGGAWGDSDPD